MPFNRENLDKAVAAQKTPTGTETVHLPEYEGDALLRPLTYQEVRYIAELEKEDRSDPYVFACVLVDEDGWQLFDPVVVKNYYDANRKKDVVDKPADLEAVEAFLKGLTAASYRKMNRAIARMNGMDKEGREDVEGN